MITFIPTPIGNLEDISLRAIKALENADILLCEDTRITKKLLHLLEERFDLKRKEQNFISVHSHNEDEFINNLDKEFFTKNVAYVSDAGMPGISDPGQKIISYCIDNSIEYDVLPGANAVLTAFVMSGFVSTSFSFLGFLPHKGSSRSEALNSALHKEEVVILYESPHRLVKLLKEISEIEPGREIFLAKEITKKYQTLFRGDAKTIFESISKTTIKGEWVVVISAGKVETKLTMGVDDIMQLNLPKKQVAKLLSKVTGKSPKECYNELI